MGKPSGQGPFCASLTSKDLPPPRRQAPWLSCSQNGCHSGGGGGAAAGTREQVLRHCYSPGLRAKWTQNTRAGCQGPAAHMGAATQSSTRVTGATSTAGAHCRHGSLSGFQLEGAEWSARHPGRSGVGSSAHPAPVPAAVPPRAASTSLLSCSVPLRVSSKKIQTGKIFQAAPVLPLRLQRVNTAKGLSWHSVRTLLPKNLEEQSPG